MPDHPPRFDPGQIQKVIDQPGQPFSLGIDDLQELLPILWVHLVVAQEDLREGPDRGQGRSQLVGYGREERVLHGVQLLQVFVGLLELPGAFLDPGLQLRVNPLEPLLRFPFRTQSRGKLPNLLGVDRLANVEQLVRGRGTFHHLEGVDLGIARHQHDLCVGVQSTDLLRRPYSIQPRRHAHVQEDHRKGPLLLPRLSDSLDRFFRLMTTDHVKGCGRRLVQILVVTKDILVEIQDELFVVCHENTRPGRTLAAHFHVPTLNAWFPCPLSKDRNCSKKRLNFGRFLTVEMLSELQIFLSFAEE